MLTRIKVIVRDPFYDLRYDYWQELDDKGVMHYLREPKPWWRPVDVLARKLASFLAVYVYCEGMKPLSRFPKDKS